jgi:hypothetical protein
MQRISLINIAHQHISALLLPGDIAIDATLGNGHDALFLMTLVAPSGQVFGFDIQLAAIAATQAKSAGATGLTLIHASHALMAENIPVQYHGYIKAIMFNLGYLPGGDKSIITQTESTLSALNAATLLLAPDGIMTIMAYPGHAGGDLEAEQIQRWCEQLDNSKFSYQILYSTVTSATAPRLFILRKTHLFTDITQ